VVTASAPAAALGVTVRVATDADRQAWDAFVAASARDRRGALTTVGSSYHDWAWREIFSGALGHECVYLVAQDAQGRICGVLPLVFIRSRLFGRSLTSLPFVNYGGVLAESDGVARTLVDAARAEAARLGSRHVELRHVGRRFPDLPCKQHKVVMRLPIGPGMWEILDRKVRNQIRKAEKSGLTAARGGAELAGAFYTVFARNMRDLGTPVYARSLFDRVLAAFPDRARIVVVSLKGTPVAAGLTYRTADMTEVPWASSIRDYNPLCPNHLLYWTILEAAVADGCSELDFGRSTPDEGTYKFKAQWGAEPLPLHWEYALHEGAAMPDQSPKNPKYQVAIAAWQRCPLWLANTLGPHIVRSIP
jgi:FemAB-related protein (PEP-CTERM system-associated)